jgi:hypothetical protein
MQTTSKTRDPCTNADLVKRVRRFIRTQASPSWGAPGLGMRSPKESRWITLGVEDSWTAWNRGILRRLQSQARRSWNRPVYTDADLNSGLLTDHSGTGGC